jgi:hypothetical protein
MARETDFAEETAMNYQKERRRAEEGSRAKNR